VATASSDISRTLSGRTFDGPEVVRLLLANVQSFVDVNHLRKTFAGLAGVQSVQMRPEGRGAFTAFITYEGMVPLAVHLNELLSRRGDTLPAHVTIEEYESGAPAAMPVRNDGRDRHADHLRSGTPHPATDAPSAA
jgi:hypothetical protein